MDKVKKLLSDGLRAEIDHQFSKGRVMSSIDVTYLLDHELEVYEDQNGDVFPEHEFEQYIDNMIVDLDRKGLIYIAGDIASYSANVIEFGMISLQEAIMGKSIRKYVKAIEAGETATKTVFRDTEFPYDETTGRYVLPKE